MNALYDRKCVANKVEQLTNSERGCAASHLALWRRHYYLPSQDA